MQIRRKNSKKIIRKILARNAKYLSTKSCKYWKPKGKIRIGSKCVWKERNFKHQKS